MNKRDTILIVDDVEINRIVLRGLFQGEYNLLEAENGEQALVLIAEYHSSIAVMLLDLVLPLKSGYQVMEELARQGLMSEFPVIVITADGSADKEVRAFDLGAADIIMKPFEPHVVRRRVQNMAELNQRKLYQQELIEEQATRLRESNSVMVDALSSIIEYRSVETGQHIKRIRMFTEILLRDISRCYPEYELDETKIKLIVSASSMHDIGKIAIPDAILQKPGRLTPSEFEVMKTHATKGCAMLVNLDRMTDRDYLQYAYNICRYHHERWDGNGYPDGLKGDSIPICAQAVSIADCYDALTNNRVYKKALPPDRAILMLLNGECGTFSPKLLESLKNVRPAFEQLLRDYADRKPQPTADLRLVPTLRESGDGLDTLQMGQMKYFTLLRYMGATVIEVDLSSGLYHVVYLSNPSFEPLRNGNSISEAVQAFVTSAVHPDDQESALALLTLELPNFFREGLMKLSRRYRVQDQPSQRYQWYQVDVLRVDLAHPAYRRVLLIWHPLAAQQESLPTQDHLDSSVEQAPLLSDVLGCMYTCLNDQWFTLVQMTSGLTALLGYSNQEILEQFQGRYLLLLHPNDRAKVLLQTAQQLNEGKSLELEYRLVTRGGRIIWVLDKSHLVADSDGSERLVGVVIDVTSSQIARQQAQLTLERYQTVLDQSNDIVFEWDIKADYVTYSSNWVARFGYPPISEQASVLIPQRSHIHPEDLSQFARLVSDMRRGKPMVQGEFRLADAKGQYRWCRARVTTQRNQLGQSAKAVGILADIDEEKRASLRLKCAAEQDGLTQLDRKSFARQRIEHRLSQSQAGDTFAMLLVDVDRFKQINLDHGHLFGDVLLQELAGALRHLCSPGNVIARVGGDEFLVFLPVVSDEGAVSALAQRVIETAHRLFQADDLPCVPTCSIGISFFPRDGRSYATMFQHCDLALYQAKAKGGDQFFVFEWGMTDRVLRRPTPADVADPAYQPNDLSEKMIGALIEQVFRTLYQSHDLIQAVNAILALLGRQFGVSRVYMFELAPGQSSFTNTLEWCDENTPSTKAQLSRFRFGEPDQWEEYCGLFDENGVLYCPDTARLPAAQRDFLAALDVVSVLQCEIRDESGLRGLIGVDDCTARRFWSVPQVNTLSFIARLMSTFLPQWQAQNQAVATACTLRAILDRENVCVYVVDPDSFQLRYLNAKVRTLVPSAAEGMRCYEAFFHRTEPCAHCPALVGRTQFGTADQIYNPYLELWNSVSASFVPWENRDAYLLTWQDILPAEREIKDAPEGPLLPASHP